MKKKILLFDDSLTVQKVVSLTLDKSKFQVLHARSRPEAVKQIVDQLPHLILVSDRVAELDWQVFPKEVETWLGRGVEAPKLVLMTSADIQSARHYAAVLKKPFNPEKLLSIIAAELGEGTSTDWSEMDAPDSGDRLKSTFDATFNESDLVKETFKNAAIEEEAMLNDDFRKSQDKRSKTLENLWDDAASSAHSPLVGGPKESVGELWGAKANDGGSLLAAPPPTVMSAEDSMAYKSLLENQVRSRLESQDLAQMVDKALAKILPPIVEKLVQERLDKLLADQEQSLHSSHLSP